MNTKRRPSGIEEVGDMPWGTHFCLFYDTKEDLLNVLLRYFKAGLENHEFCLWVTPEPLSPEEAKRAMREAGPEFERHMAEGQIEIVSYTDWYLAGGSLDTQRILQDWIDKHDQAIANGYAGLRCTGNTFWLEKHQWDSFAKYEAEIDKVLSQLQIIVLCTYPLERCSAADVLDVVHHHQFTVAKRNGVWEYLEGFELKRAHDEIRQLNADLERRVLERTAELAAANEQLQQEVTERKQAEALLHAREQEFRAFVENAPDQIIRYDKEFRRAYVNPAVSAAYGLPKEAFIGKPVGSILEQLGLTTELDQVTAIRRQIKSVFDTGEPTEYEVTFPLPGGRRTYWTRMYPEFDPNGVVINVLGISRDITERKQAEADRERLFEELRQSHEQLKALSSRLAEVQESERKRLAREIHDDIGQSLTALMMQLGTVRSLLPKSAGAAHAILEQTEDLTQKTIERTRMMIADLRPSLLDELGLIPAMRRLGEELHENTGALVTMKMTHLPKRLPPQIEVALFRITQEALTNIRKHAQARHVTVALTKAPGWLILSVRDDGVGFENDNVVVAGDQEIPAGHFGLIGIQERVKLLGGRFRMMSTPNQGTTIRVELPL